jgi:NADH-quinone oxidoreductase subunit L
MEQIILLAPLAAAIIAGFGWRIIGETAAQWLTTIVLFFVCLLSWIVFFSHDGTTEHIELFRWIQSGTLDTSWGIRVDRLTAIMFIVITTVSALVHLYSLGYMDGDENWGEGEYYKARFFAYLSFFTFAMLALVTADNILQLFFGWEGVGLASYLLIGFYYKKPSANAAAIKAFVVNRVGDFGFLLGIFGLFFLVDSIRFDDIFAAGPQLAETQLSFLWTEWNAANLLAFLLFIGAMGKSAQIFLHTWLPDAMEGPTPVSALIHAATMVTAGVFLVCRMSPLFEYAPEAKTFVLYIGATTAFFAATVGLVQNDIKRVIAYSTCSQLGYMFAAAGVGVYNVAMFHLLTHAFFKALLFLGAGSVITAMHHEQDMRKMGGLAKFMPVTYAAMLIGTIAIIGLGVPQTLIGFSGFFSKDAILESAFAAGEHHVMFGQVAFWFGIVAALLTSFYSWRLIYMTFHGPMASAHEDGDAHHDAHDADHAHDPHESPATMLVPLALLSLGAMFAGFYFHEWFVGSEETAFWGGTLYSAADNHVLHDRHNVPQWVLWAPLVVTLAGFVIATMTYYFNRGFGKRIADSGGPLYQLFSNKWYFDELYNATLVKGSAMLGNAFSKADKKIIDGLGPDGVTSLTRWGARRLSAMHTGYLYHYAFVIIGAALVFGAVMWLNAGGAN